MGEYFNYCKSCGAEHILGIGRCQRCLKDPGPGWSKHEIGYYQQKSIEQFGNPDHAWDILLEEEIKLNPFYNSELAAQVNTEEYEQKRIEYKREAKEVRDKQIIKEAARVAREKQQASLPKCPLCNSTNLKKISGMRKALHAYAFGLFSNTAKSQFECGNCGYKF